MVVGPWLYHVSSALSIPPQRLQGILLHRCGNCLQINHKKCKFLLCCRCCQALLHIFLPCILWAVCHIAQSGRAAFFGA